MIEVTSEVVIDRPAEEVFTFLADAENNPTWQRGMQRCQWTSTPPIREGSIIPVGMNELRPGHYVATFFGAMWLQGGVRWRRQASASFAITSASTWSACVVVRS